MENMKSLTDSQLEYIERTKLAREKTSKKQEDIAADIGVDRVTYTGYETRRTMPQKYIARFCKATGVTERWLLTGEGDMDTSAHTDKEKLMAEVFRDLDEELQDMALTLVKAMKEREK